MFNLSCRWNSCFLLCIILFTCCSQKPAENAAKTANCDQWSENDDGITCAYLTVPRDWDNPEKGDMQLFYVRLAALGENPSEDPLIFLQGGPGGAATPMVDFFRQSILRNDRDIIIMDQRGTGYSSPLCVDMGEKYFEVFARDLEPKEEAIELQKISDECSLALREKKFDKTTFNSRSIIRDFEALRNKLDIDQWNILGASYGSRLGLTYLREYPEAIRSAALQGLFPPEARLYAHLISNFHRSLDRVFSECENDPVCSEKHPDLEAVFYGTLDKLRQNPYRFDMNGKEVVINAQDYLLIVIFSLYNRSTIENSLTYLIESVRDKNEVSLQASVNQCLAMLNLINGAMYMSVTAYEELPFSGQDDLDGEIARYPELSPGPAFYMSDPYLLKRWHRARASELEDQAVSSDKPVLLISGDLDPVTPPSNAETILSGLSRAQHLVFRNESHSNFSRCYIQRLRQFFTDPFDQYLNDCDQYDRDLSIN